jgi:hypothetical protein
MGVCTSKTQAALVRSSAQTSVRPPNLLSRPTVTNYRPSIESIWLPSGTQASIPRRPRCLSEILPAAGSAPPTSGGELAPVLWNTGKLTEPMEVSEAGRSHLFIHDSQCLSCLLVLVISVLEIGNWITAECAVIVKVCLGLDERKSSFSVQRTAETMPRELTHHAICSTSFTLEAVSSSDICPSPQRPHEYPYKPISKIQNTN